MKADRTVIERLVPQGGTMCLLGAVVDWDATQIVCTASEPSGAHPLLSGDDLPGIAACEYAAQAAAVHGALVEGKHAPVAGMLAKLMDVDLHLAVFPRAGGALTVRAQQISRVAKGCLYAFVVEDATARVASGRLMVAFGKPAR